MFKRKRALPNKRPPGSGIGHVLVYTPPPVVEKPVPKRAVRDTTYFPEPPIVAVKPGFVVRDATTTSGASDRIDVTAFGDTTRRYIERGGRE